jgi:hypothetical protein
LANRAPREKMRELLWKSALALGYYPSFRVSIGDGAAPTGPSQQRPLLGDD